MDNKEKDALWRIKMMRYGEILWMVMAIVCLCLTTYSLIMKDQKDATVFLIATMVAGAMFAFRKGIRKRMQKHHDEKYPK